MRLIIGLGNPGKKFIGTRHNLGFSVLNAFRKKYQFSHWQERSRLKSKISTGKINSQKIILAKPQTFMNSSGEAAALLIGNWKLEIGNLIVVHDDLDLPLGKIKISAGQGSAGHKGIQSIIDELKTQVFIRLRLGIAPRTILRTRTAENLVLQKFSQDERKIIYQAKNRALEALEVIIGQGIEKAMNEFS